MARLIKSKVYKLTCLLTDDEMDELGKWMLAPLFKVSPKVLEIHNVIQQNRLSDTLINLTKKQLYETLYPGKSYSASYLNNLIRKYTIQVENYLIWSGVYYQENKKLAYFSELRRRGEQDLFFKEAEDFLNDHIIEKNNPDFTTNFILQLYELIYYHSGNHSKYDLRIASSQRLNQYIETFFLEKKLAILFEQQTIASIKKIPFDRSEWTSLNSYLKKSNSPIVSLYQKRISRAKPIDMEAFNLFYESYLRVYDQIPIIEKQIFLLMTINDAIVLTTQGNKMARLQLMNLYKFGIREKLLLIPEVVTPFMFNNIVSAAIQEKEFVYLEDLLWQYKDVLPVEWQEDAINWGRLNIGYAQGVYEDVWSKVRAYQCRHWLYKLQFRIIEMMALAELIIAGSHEIKLMQSTVDAFEKYIQRNDKNYQFRPEPYRSFIKYTYRLVKIKRKGQVAAPKDISLLREELIHAPRVYRRDWLLERLER